MLESDSDMIWLVVTVSVAAGFVLGLIVGRSWPR